MRWMRQPVHDLVVDALAAFRLTRLVVADTITEGPRAKLLARIYLAARRPPPADMSEPGNDWTHAVQDDPDPPKLATLVTCPWCAGFYVSIGVVVARRLAPRAWAPIARAFAISGVAGVLGAQYEG